MALVSTETDVAEAKFSDDVFPPETMIGQVPSWVVDTSSGFGRLALASFLTRPTYTAALLKKHVDPPRQMDILADGVFRVEGAKLARRCRMPLLDDLHRFSEAVCLGLDAALAEDFVVP